MHMHVSTYIAPGLHTHTHIHTHTPHMHVCTYAAPGSRTHAHTHTHTHTHTHLHVCSLACMHACTCMYIHSTWVAASLLITVVMALAIVGKTFLAVRNARVMSFLAKAHTSSVSTVSELSLSCTHQHTHVVYVYVYDAFRGVLVLHTRTCCVRICV